MKQKYFVNRVPQFNLDHEVHVQGCKYMPENKIDLGEFTNCFEAVRESKKHYSQTNGCFFCCNPCNTQ